ncbi:hypothetical protein LshimejAT787_2600240 [Lyophyllum shimeji]|uniref:Uncharacterized protein n=1 Tax=Lyophyllum shimeji TaxID=47721 RepID=A0A9P3Q2W8_LYOSH|nr:hypothetical protein LshimejAT787_2600240 [Lyophyllum shimeji]
MRQLNDEASEFQRYAIPSSEISAILVRGRRSNIVSEHLRGKPWRTFSPSPGPVGSALGKTAQTIALIHRCTRDAMFYFEHRTITTKLRTHSSIALQLPAFPMFAAQCPRRSKVHHTDEREDVTTAIQAPLWCICMSPSTYSSFRSLSLSGADLPRRVAMEDKTRDRFEGRVAGNSIHARFHVFGREAKGS